MQEWVYPKFLTKYGGRPTLLQVFTFVERIDNTIYIEEAGKLALTMGMEYSKPKVKRELKHTHVQGSLAKTEANPILHCWKCRKDGHTKKYCPVSKLKNNKVKAKRLSYD